MSEDLREKIAEFYEKCLLLVPTKKTMSREILEKFREFSGLEPTQRAFNFLFRKLYPDLIIKVSGGLSYIFGVTFKENDGISTREIKTNAYLSSFSTQELINARKEYHRHYAMMKKHE